ncbi:8-oxo-dGTP diphosphatase [Verrucomicrobium sp. GAS474]|uniref:8-oxo-dGTP diphosphatase n=1 Tax=Verrucomicrobium sp. GAS474 TaxID=1882831 RepID=UPI00087A3920|nr:8-oxo-dGTP diphosphatase [Verrucomicrobium sp. GAS474]SDU09946.1 8-oxo-dGTP diphosphatase [Verrucomicrobium sp. GAS474]
MASVPLTDPSKAIRCVLCFIVDADAGRILLIRKLRGLGAGKINGPGGKVEPGETPLAAAVRETEEEIGVTPTDLREMGDLHFRFVNETGVGAGLQLHCTVFRAGGYARKNGASCGEPVETDEAIPLWHPLDDLPFHEMWADDIFWLPLLIEGDRFEGRFRFDGEKMLEHRMKVVRGTGESVPGCCE